MKDQMDFRVAVQQPTAGDREEMINEVVTSYQHWDNFVYGITTIYAYGSVEQYEENNGSIKVKVGITFEEERDSGCEKHPYKKWKYSSVFLNIDSNGGYDEPEQGYPYDSWGSDVY